jgi:hypothetical protein
MKEHCSLCRFWLDLESISVGRCRRRSPTHSLVMTPEELDTMECPRNETYLATYFPVTDAREWCGEFEPIQEK